MLRVAFPFACFVIHQIVGRQNGLLSGYYSKSQTIVSDSMEGRGAERLILCNATAPIIETLTHTKKIHITLNRKFILERTSLYNFIYPFYLIYIILCIEWYPYFSGACSFVVCSFFVFWCVIVVVSVAWWRRNSAKELFHRLCFLFFRGWNVSKYLKNTKSIVKR